MGIAERRVPRQISILAMVGSLLGTGLLAYAGLSKPRQFTSSMAINHHSGYGGGVLACYACHVPQAKHIGTAMTCLTSNCHGELMPAVAPDAALEESASLFIGFPDQMQRAQLHLDNHALYTSQSCQSCHSEHTPAKAKKPTVWKSLAQLAAEQSQ